MKTNTFSTLACAVAALAFSQSAAAQRAVALTDEDHLVRFDLADLSSASAPVPVAGLATGESIRGLDFRPVDRTLVAVTSLDRILVLDPATGASRQLSTLSVPLTGTAFGVDFNPVPDRLRIVSDTGLNFRVNVDTGAVIEDGPLAYRASEGIDGVPAVSAAAYTNSLAGTLATSTALYDIDHARNVLVRQNPPNDGVLETVGPLGVDADEWSGFDVFGPDHAFALLQVDDLSAFHRVNLATGAATLTGVFPGGVRVVDFAIMPKERAAGIVNASSRGMVGVGEGILISGFVVTGDAPVDVLVVGRGPSLAEFGVNEPIADTTIALFRGSDLLDWNDDWSSHPRAEEIEASGFAPGDSRESALLLSLAPGVYTAHVSGATEAHMGISIVEVYELP
ncbi:hypothetical protein ASA1KI_29390 [Opitutales bacterium ASA1]|uniref:DUF4394 domain-containing protein n=1 Tax=Congregicoccus parvus TaxID=3081749 RepID=UPI002B2CC717|nr:hypothetical protein ASA1KI_29390 [Opitutales bacterium ASA1]